MTNTAALEAPRVDDPAVRCPGGVVPDTAELANRINVSIDRIERLKRIRAVDNSEICRFSKFRLARALERTHPLATGFADKAAEWRALALRDETGKIRVDGQTIAVVQRQALVRDAAAQSATAGDALAPGAGIAPNRWTALGPGNIGGRIRSLVIHPTNTQKIWAGSVSGGIWATSNGGASWSPVNDLQENLVIGSMIIDPTNSNVMYAGTGENYSNLSSPETAKGNGVYKSTDSGATWTRLASTNPATTSTAWERVTRLAVHPANGAIVLAATQFGVQRSADGGTTWTDMDPVTNFDMQDLRFHPADGTKAIGGTKSGTVRISSDAGLTWTTVTVATGGARVETAFSPSNSSIVYASVDRNNGEIYRSTDGGLTWTLRSAPGHVSAQGFHNNAIWVAPNDPNFIVAAGLDIYRSTDGGTTTTKISTWQSSPASPHADHHVIVHDPGYNGTTNKRIYNANDGGVYRTDDITAATSAATGNGWVNLNNGLEITQFYSGAGRAGGIIVGGTQDNGSLRYAGTGTNWVEFYGGDGGYSAVDSADSNFAYGEYIYLSIVRSTNGAVNAQNICTGILDGYTDPTFGCGAGATQASNFIAPFVLDPNNNNVMLGGGARLWRSTNVKAATPAWASIKPASGATNYISAIAVQQGNSDLIWVGHNNGQVYKTINGTTGSPAWTLVSGALPGRFATRILIDKDTPNTVYVTFGGYNAGNVWRTTDGGTTWTDIHGVLPQTPVRSITRHPSKPAWLYVGTEAGVFTSENGGTTWFATNDAPANVSVDELFWLDGATLVAATHGRGMFRTTVLAGNARSDLNGDGKSDIVWRNTATGDNYAYLMSGLTVSSGGYLPNVPIGWSVMGTGDFNGDGKADILWRNGASGDNYAYFMNGLTLTGGGYLPTVPIGWTVAGTGDFNGDGKTDILWRNSATGENYIYFMNGTTVTSGGYLPSVPIAWGVAGVGDLDGDGKADIVWRNSASGENYVFLMNGLTLTSQGYLPTVPIDWAVAGMGDFNGDGKNDVLWRKSISGENYIYFMNGLTVASGGFLPAVPSGWAVGGTGDHDGDGKADILWRNAVSGEVYMYMMNGLTIASQGYLPNVPAAWTVTKQ